MKPSLLLVNHDRKELSLWESYLKEWGIPAHGSRDAFTALQLLQLEKVSGVICRVDLPLLSGVELGRRIRKVDPGLTVILAAGKGPVSANESSATNIPPENLPVRMDEKKFQEMVGVLLLRGGILLREGECPHFLHQRPEFSEIIGRSSAIRAVFSLMDKVKDQEMTILIQGGSGTGKELVALAIHRHGRRADKSFVSVNCAALPETLLESELFGHEKGAFTGANSRVVGRFEQADGGCLFLDEIGDMSPATQAKVLRVLEGHEFERVGGREKIKVDVRIIAATNRDLKQRVAEGEFREDLFYRIGAFPIILPDLCERREDLPLLIAHIIRKFNRRSPQKIEAISPAAYQKLYHHDWPGNIRELENVVNRAAVFADAGKIEAHHIMLGEEEEREGRKGEEETSFVTTRIKSLSEAEEEALRQALQKTSMNVSKAARGLGISRATLYKKAKEYGIKIRR